MGKLLGFYLWLRERLKEPSTHAALASIAGSVGMNIDAGILHDIAIILGLGFGGLGFWFKEQKPETVV